LLATNEWEAERWVAKQRDRWIIREIAGYEEMNSKQRDGLLSREIGG
jgi:hypothetical protein